MRLRFNQTLQIGFFSVVIIIIFVIVNALGFFNSFRAFFSPVQNIITLNSGNTSTDEYATELLTEISRLKFLQEENSDLRGLLNFYKEKSYSQQITNVISYDPISLTLFYLDIRNLKQ